MLHLKRQNTHLLKLTSSTQSLALVVVSENIEASFVEVLYHLGVLQKALHQPCQQHYGCLRGFMFECSTNYVDTLAPKPHKLYVLLPPNAVNIRCHVDLVRLHGCRDI